MVSEIPISLESAKEQIQKLTGVKISHVWRGVGTSLFLELGELEQRAKRKNMKGQQTIMIEWSWRIENEHAIEVGSWSDIEEIDKVPALLIGNSITNIDFFGKIPELMIQLNRSLYLLSFMTEKGGPMWSIELLNGEWLRFRDGDFIVQQQT